MRDWLRLLMAIVLLSCVGGRALAAETQWWVSGDKALHRIEGSGDVTGAAGANVSLLATPDSQAAIGAATTRIDAAPFIGMRITLSGTIAVRGTNALGRIWLRADAPAGRVAFATSEHSPVREPDGAVQRSIGFDVPPSATSIVLGPLLSGGGSVSITSLRLAAAPQVTPRQVVDAALRIVQADALYASRIDWPATTLELRARADSAKAPADTRAIVRELIAQLGDGHSRLVPADSAKEMARSGTASFDAVVEVDASGLGRVEMPGFRGTDEQKRKAFASGIARQFAMLAPRATCGWIVDLRRDSGGNMWPMLSAVASLLGTATVGSFEDARGTRVAWPIEAADAPDVDLTAARVAVLTGPQTASSGEAITVAFKGRPGTRSFGAATAGLSTSNRMFALPDGSGLLLTTARFVDRDGKAYGGPIEPDETTAPAGTEAAAARWLGCRK